MKLFTFPDPATLDPKPERAILHWTGGTYVAGSHERRCYNLLIEWPSGRASPRLIAGVPFANQVQGVVAGNEYEPDVNPGGYAPHTWGFNTRSLGYSICAMHGARNRNEMGDYPLLPEMVDTLVGACRITAAIFGWPVDEDHFFTHYEAHTLHGVPQNPERDASRPPWKWDITVVPNAPTLGPDEVGPWLRAQIQEVDG